MMTYNEFKEKAHRLPEWYDVLIHNKVCEILRNSDKLQAVKYLWSISKENNTVFTGEGDCFGLKWAKIEVVDIIDPPYIAVPKPRTVRERLEIMTDEELIRLSDELKNTTVPDDALIREVIDGSDMDTVAPMIAFVGIGQLLSFELAERLRGRINNSNTKLD